MLGKIKADFRKNWVSWVGFLGLAAIGIPLIVYCQLERGVLAPWDSYMFKINILMAAIISWTVMYFTLFLLSRYKVVQAWKRELKRNKNNDSGN